MRGRRCNSHVTESIPVFSVQRSPIPRRHQRRGETEITKNEKKKLLPLTQIWEQPPDWHPHFSHSPSERAEKSRNQGSTLPGDGSRQQNSHGLGFSTRSGRIWCRPRLQGDPQMEHRDRARAVLPQQRPPTPRNPARGERRRKTSDFSENCSGIFGQLDGERLHFYTTKELPPRETPGGATFSFTP